VHNFIQENSGSLPSGVAKGTRGERRSCTQALGRGVSTHFL